MADEAVLGYVGFLQGLCDEDRVERAGQYAAWVRVCDPGAVCCGFSSSGEVLSEEQRGR